MNEILTLLNAKTREERLENLRRLMPTLEFPPAGNDVNNHIHTTFSFSPYSPTAAAYMAKKAGLCTAGCMDHDSVSGCYEFLEACEILGIAGTIGVECRVKFADTPFEDCRINNPDQNGLAYVLMHGIPHARIETVDAFFAPLREKRNLRNRAMVEKINELYGKYGVSIDFEEDVLPLSEDEFGGTVTERHISSALAYELERLGGEDLIGFIENTMGRKLADKYRTMLGDENNPYRHYDLIGWIKAEFIAEFYLPASDECPDVRDFLKLSEQVGAVSAYAYLGDVGNSATGDKRAQAFEDAYLDKLFIYLKDFGFRAITFMPTRNTPEQLKRVRGLIKTFNFFEISGEDINQPRQSFICQAMRQEGFESLVDAAWALIAHERREKGLYHRDTIYALPELTERVAAFAKEAKEL